MDQPTAAPATEPAKHIRTYASDVAKLTGKPLPKNVKNEPAPPPPPPPPARIIPKAPTTNETKEAVLERLKKKALAYAPQPSKVPAHTPVPKAPSTKETKEEVLSRLKRTASEIPPGIAQVQKPAAPERIHTYTSDFTQRTKEAGASRVQMVAQEADAAPAPQVFTKKSRGPSFTVVAAAVLVVAGIGLIYGAYRLATGEPSIPYEPFITSPIFVDERVKVSGSSAELRAALSSPTISLGDGEVALLYLAHASTTDEGVVEMIAAGGVLIDALSLPAPNLLLRNIEPESIVGLIRTNEETRPFFIFKVGSYERTFAAMLEWEATMERDLAFMYPPHPLEEMGTSTPFRLSFVDEVIGNRDARVLRDGEGRAVLLYGYRDKSTLIIARNEAAFLELLARLSSSSSK